MGLGCQIGGLWYGACSYADNLVLLAPNRDVLQKIIHFCEQYAMEHNLKFSTDSIPSKFKTKCILLCGKQSKVKYPDPVMLNGEALPWFDSADHLGHIIDQSITMEKDCRRARAKHIEINDRQGINDEFHRAFQKI